MEKHYKTNPSLKIHNAIMFAAVAHKRQLRKGTKIPYISHPMEVMQILTENGCPEDVIVAGILHDTLEDTNAKAEDIENLFGRKVLDIIKAETENKSETWVERKKHTVEHVKRSSKSVQLVCCADKLANIKSIYADTLKVGDRVFARFSAPNKEYVKWYYTEIVKSLTKINKYKMKQELEFFVKLVFRDK